MRQCHIPEEQRPQAEICHFRGAEPAGGSRGKRVLTVILPDESRYV
jgi:hypothetical protein